jgi:uncharacterized protein
MKSVRLKLQDECDTKKVILPVVEKDYALSYILAGLAKQPELSHSLIFKGGTALKKMFFGDYRFSEDLDFSVINAPKNKALEKALKNAIGISKDLLNNYGPFDIELKRNPEREAHPKGQEAFNAYVRFPWQTTTHCRIKIEITHDEPVILAPEYKPVMHGYEEQLDCAVACYKVEEIISEKLRALLQTHQKLIARGWTKPRARDYYDLWCVLKKYSNSVDKKKILMTLQRKCQHRNVSYSKVDDFFSPELIRESSKHWQATLGVLVRDLPDYEMIMKEVRQSIEDIF